jgi:hypothetical protein
MVRLPCGPPFFTVSPSSLWSHRKASSTAQRRIYLLVLHVVLLSRADAATCEDCTNIPPTSATFAATNLTCVTAVYPGSWYAEHRCSNAPIDTVWHNEEACAQSCSEAGLPYNGLTCCPPGSFTTRAALVAAVDSWLDDEASAAAFYGNISSWDVSQVTDMQACRLERHQSSLRRPNPSASSSSRGCTCAHALPPPSSAPHPSLVGRTRVLTPP